MKTIKAINSSNFEFNGVVYPTGYKAVVGREDTVDVISTFGHHDLASSVPPSDLEVLDGDGVALAEAGSDLNTLLAAINDVVNFRTAGVSASSTPANDAEVKANTAAIAALDYPFDRSLQGDRGFSLDTKKIYEYVKDDGSVVLLKAVTQGSVNVPFNDATVLAAQTGRRGAYYRFLPLGNIPETRYADASYTASRWNLVTEDDWHDGVPKIRLATADGDIRLGIGMGLADYRHTISGELGTITPITNFVLLPYKKGDLVVVWSAGNRLEIATMSSGSGGGGVDNTAQIEDAKQDLLSEIGDLNDAINRNIRNVKDNADEIAKNKTSVTNTAINLAAVNKKADDNTKSIVTIKGKSVLLLQQEELLTTLSFFNGTRRYTMDESIPSGAIIKVLMLANDGVTQFSIDFVARKSGSKGGAYYEGHHTAKIEQIGGAVIEIEVSTSTNCQLEGIQVYEKVTI